MLRQLLASAEVKRRVAQELLPQIEAAARMLIESYASGGKTVFLGNGGSAADAQHLAGELVGRFLRERRALPAIALTANSSTVTAIANDYGYDDVFARQVEAWVEARDVLVAISTSGNSPNVLRAVEAARARGARAIGMTGRTGGKLAELCDIVLTVPSD
ncbi:SIS domain-containing protein, partial [Candidatus Poribacteria bacterium]|nr:SIS domain-containing protein [Candidatus Poribacteria bacterium]